MDPMPTLRTALLDLLYETRGADLKLILGGGYGLYLKREILREQNTRTLLDQWPEARSTNDLDLFLRPELLINATNLRPLAEAIRQLGYEVIPGAEKYQFVRPGPSGDTQGAFKIDFLTGPQSRFAGTKVRVDGRRARPNPSVELHAHPTDESITLEVGLTAAKVAGTTSAGIAWEGEIYLPHPFTSAMMKLFAFHDRKDDAEKGFGQHHAMDLYAVVAMMTEPEWDLALELGRRNADEPAFREACRIVQEHFATAVGLGILRIRESDYHRPALQLDEFRSALAELFPNPTPGKSGQ